MRVKTIVVFCRLCFLPAAAGADSPLDRDLRLSQTVSCCAASKDSAAILAEISKKTGVTLRAGYNAGDWPVRESQMNVFAKDVPLRDLMNSMARVMKCKWSIGGMDDAPTYRFIADTRVAPQGLAKLDAAEQQRTEARKNYLADCSAADEIFDDLAKMKDTDPDRYLSIKSGVSSSLAGIMSEIPGAKDAFSSGSTFEVKCSDLSPAALAALTRFVEAGASIIADEDRKASFQAIADNLSSLTFQINRPSTASTPAWVLGVILFRSDAGGVGGYPIIDPDSEGEKLAAGATIKALEEGRDLTEPENQAFDDAFEAEANRISAAEPAVDHSKDAGPKSANPVLDAEITIKASSGLCKVEQQLAEASKLCVVSDSFKSSDGRAEVASGKRTPRSVLDQVSKDCDYNWWKRGSTIELRDRRWLERRSEQIPEAWLAKWRSAIKKNGKLDLDALVEIAGLTPKQLVENLDDDDLLGKTTVVKNVSSNRDLLTFYGSLSKTQSDGLLTDAGLDLRSLPDECWKQAQQLISRKDPKLVDQSDPSVSMTLARKDNTCVFRVFGDDKSKAITLDNRASHLPAGLTPKQDTPQQRPTSPARYIGLLTVNAVTPGYKAL